MAFLIFVPNAVTSEVRAIQQIRAEPKIGLLIQSYSSFRQFFNSCKSCLTCLNFPLGSFTFVIILVCKKLQDLILGGVQKTVKAFGKKQKLV